MVERARSRIATHRLVRAVLCLVACFSPEPLVANASDSSPPVKLQRDDRAGQLRVLIDGREAMVYQYGPGLDLPHYYPLRSPSGKLLTVLDAPHDPHHRSLWFADTVRLKNHRESSFYFAQRSRLDPKDPRSPFRDRIRHVKFLAEDAASAQATIEEQLLWEADLGKTPVLDESRKTCIAALGNGEYLLDVKFEVKAAYGDVEFLSDRVHYAWPYVRMSRAFSVDKGHGTMTNSEGGVNEKATHDKPARWVDYLNTVGGVAEGLAISPPRKRPPASLAHPRLRCVRSPPRRGQERQPLHAEARRLAETTRGHPSSTPATSTPVT